MLEILFIIFAYLLGSIPFGLLLTRMKGFGDIRKIGSGNIGATNVLRTGNKTLAICTLLLDAAKGVVAILIASIWLDENSLPIIGTAAVLGHIFPIWLKFKGGKGVATTLAVYATIAPVIALFACVVWIAIFAISRISSLSAIISLFLSPVVTWFIMPGETFLMTVILGAIVIFRHKENIIRIFRGQEKPFKK
ncbi:glycerol-3-phosphate 1-O-acyltransferase PlsY [Rickettsiales bacterium]|nr:glycerol-3-phosphate 1-O-acyltransferase PlsY [Rickettsiales bacterium]